MDYLKNINWDGRTFGYSLLMINDAERNQFYQQALGNVQGKTVLDIGAGTGLLSVIAVTQGARRVYSFEREINNYNTAKKFIDQSGLGDRIHLICADILEVDQTVWPHDPIDVTITETFANDCFIENFAFLVEYVEKHFNLAPDHRWIPESVDLNLDLINVDRAPEFCPGVDLPEQYQIQIEQAVQTYRDYFYHKNSLDQHGQTINMPVAQIPPTDLDQLTLIDTYLVDVDLRANLDRAQYHIALDHSHLAHPYIKVDWVVHSGNNSLKLNQAISWRNIAFKVDSTLGNKFYFRFNPYTHALIGTQHG